LILVREVFVFSTWFLGIGGLMLQFHDGKKISGLLGYIATSLFGLGKIKK
jgi:hypothetical protein